MARSITDSAFEGFRLMAARPLTLVGWAIFGVVAGLVLVALLLVAVGPAMLANFARLSAGDQAVTPSFDGLMSWFWIAAAAMIVGTILVNAVQTAAVYRSVLRPAERQWAYLRVGADELRLILLTLAYFVLGMITFGGAILLLVLAAGAAGDGGFLIGFVGGLALFCLGVFLAVRLSLAAAITFAEGRVSLFGSWALTRGHFWPLVGMYLVVLVLSIVISLGGSALAQIFLGLGMQEFIQAWAASAAGPGHPPDFSAVGPMVVVSAVGYVVVALAVNVVQLAVTYAPQAAAYRFLTGPGPETTSEVFS